MTRDQKEFCKRTKCKNCENLSSCKVKDKVIKYSPSQVEMLIRKDLDSKGYDVDKISYIIEDKYPSKPVYEDYKQLKKFNGIVVHVYERV